jgi:hypothetical protein
MYRWHSDKDSHIDSLFVMPGELITGTPLQYLNFS